MWGEPASINLSSQGHCHGSGAGVPALRGPARGTGQGCRAPSCASSPRSRHGQRAAGANPSLLCFPPAKGTGSSCREPGEGGRYVPGPAAPAQRTKPSRQTLAAPSRRMTRVPRSRTAAPTAAGASAAMAPTGQHLQSPHRGSPARCVPGRPWQPATLFLHSDKTSRPEKSMDLGNWTHNWNQKVEKPRGVWKFCYAICLLSALNPAGWHKRRCLRPTVPKAARAAETIFLLV